MNAAKPHLWAPGRSGNPNGRPKKLLNRIDEMCAKDGKHPYTELMALLPELKPREQADVWLQLLAYCMAKPTKHEQEPLPFEPSAEFVANLEKALEDWKHKQGKAG